MCNCNKNTQSLIIPPMKDMVHGASEIIKTRLHIGVADKDTIQKRRDACRVCPEATRSSDPKFSHTNGLTSRSQCKACHGCFIVEKTKRLNETCPIKLW